MSSHVDEESLIRRARQGDPVALSELYTLHVDAIYRFLLHRTGDAMVAEDLTAEVFANMLTSIRRYRMRGTPFRAWLFRIARARLADYWRKEERRRRYEEEPARPLSDDPTLAGAEMSEDRFEYEALQQAMRYLTPAEREVILLRFAGGLSHREIAKVVRSNANAVKSRIYRALKKLREILERRATYEE